MEFRAAAQDAETFDPAVAVPDVLRQANDGQLAERMDRAVRHRLGLVFPRPSWRLDTAVVLYFLSWRLRHYPVETTCISTAVLAKTLPLSCCLGG